VLLGCAALVLGYAAAVRLRFSKAALAFMLGDLVLLIALVSPLHTLGDTYLFSAHMLQHLLLLLVVPPLLLLGLPSEVIQAALRRPLLCRSEQFIGQPIIAWTVGLGAMWLWHLPVLYNAALHREAIHIIEHLCFLVTAMIFWWPVLAPLPQPRLQPLLAVLYLFAAMLVSGVLGMLLTFAGPGLYPAYLRPRDTFRILPLLHGRWGLTPAVDQQLGGLLMWVPGSLVYLAAIIGVLARWYGAPDENYAEITYGKPDENYAEITTDERFHDVPLTPQPRRTTDVV
jgi:cytochrome c oxidase assembly factor CtaG